MNKYVPTIALVLNFKEDTETIYKVNNQYFKICVPHNAKYETDFCDCEFTDIVKNMTDIFDEDYDEPFFYDIEFVDRDFGYELMNRLEHPSFYDDADGMEYARQKLLYKLARM